MIRTIRAATIGATATVVLTGTLLLLPTAHAEHPSTIQGDWSHNKAYIEYLERLQLADLNKADIEHRERVRQWLIERHPG